MYSVVLMMVFATHSELVNDSGANNDKLKPVAVLSAEEQNWLKTMRDAEKDSAERAKIEVEFSKDSHVGRKATYDLFEKMKGKGQISSEREMKKAKGENGTEKATIVVMLPASARLAIDGKVTPSASSSRTFVVPNMVPGQTYSYTFVAQYLSNGRMVTVNMKVVAEAGKTTHVNMNVPPGASSKQQ